MRAAIKHVYTFDELSETAKDRARDWYRQRNESDNFFSESVIEDAARLGAMTTVGGHYVHSHSMDIDVDRSDDVTVSDEDAETVRECLRDFADWIYRSLEREYEYQNADEQIDESIRANEYEFTEEGRRA